MTGFLQARTRAALEQLLADDDATAIGSTEPLERLRHLRAAAALLETEPAALAAVRDALHDTAGDWDAIAAAAGFKATAAKWRWQGTDAEIAARLEAGRKRSARPSSVPTDLPGYSVAEAAKKLGVSVQAVYLRISRGQLESQTVTLDDGRSYKRVMLE
jgi:DNA-directed RNA polymerase specialized sigma24 family protein